MDTLKNTKVKNADCKKAYRITLSADERENLTQEKDPKRVEYPKLFSLLSRPKIKR